MKTYLKLIVLPALLASCAAAPVRTVHSSKTTNKVAQKTSKKKTPSKTTKRMAGQEVAETKNSLPLDPIQVELNNAKAYEVSEQWLKATLSYAEVAQKAIAPKDQDLAKSKAIFLIDNKLERDDLKNFFSESSFAPLKAHAALKLGKTSLAEKEYSDAEDYFEKVISLDPDSSIASEAQSSIDVLDSLRKVEPKTVGVVLPLSGKNAAQGQRALKGIMMGLGSHQAHSPFKIAVIDSEGQPESARAAVDRLIKEDHVIAILGDIVSKSSESVALAANEYNIPVIALSQRPGLTEIGPTIFRNALTPSQQVRQLVRSAMLDMGMKRFAILYPNDAYGIEYTNIFWDEVIARGGSISAVQIYNPNEKDLRIPVEKLLGVYYGEARQAEYYLSLREIKAQEKKRSARQSNSEVVLKPITDFDGIFIPDGSKNFGQLAALISYYDVTQAKFLGTNLWNSPGISKRTGIFGDSVFFVDTYLGADQEASLKFASEFKSIFTEEPSLIEIQAYDSALLLRQILASGVETRMDLVAKLNSTEGFPGAAGEVKMGSNRELLRPLTTLTLQKGEVVPAKTQK